MDIEFVNDSKFKGKKVVRYSGDIEPHEALLDNLAQKKEEEIGVSSRKFEVPLSKRTLSGFFVLAMIVLIFLFAKTFQMQVFQGAAFTALAANNKFAVSQIQAERGVIYDSNMNQLVYNIPSFSLVVNKSGLPKDAVKEGNEIKEVASILNENPEDLQNKIDSGQTPIVSGVPHATLIALESRISNLPGFEINQDWTRQYQDANYFSDIIGYMGQISATELKNSTSSAYTASDWVGKAGLEKSYESILRKNPGELQIEKDALGNEISQKVIEQPQSGDSLVLWLDSGLQKKITDTLEQVAKTVGVTKAAAVAMDPNTGGVLSLVSVPTFDNNLFNKGSDQAKLSALINDPNHSLYNMAISGQFPSGSTIKPLLASGVLQENLISPDKQIYCGPYITIPNPWDPNNPTIKRDWTTHGWTDMRKAIAESSDVYFYTVGGGYGDQKGLGAANIDKYLGLFGWGTTTGIDLPGENAGLVPSPAEKLADKGTIWTDGDTYNITIGQGDMLVTPIQMAASFVAVANGGTLYEPQIVQKILGPDKNVVKDSTPQVVRQNFIDPANLQVVKEGMREAVTGKGAPLASAVMLNSLPIQVAAKTGTAETGKYVNGVELLDNWIVLFAPYNNPKIVLTIMFQNVQGEQAATLPAAKDILQWYFSQGSSTTSPTSSG